MPGGAPKGFRSVMAVINAAKTHCKRGHEFTPANTRLGKGGRRVCRACRRAAGVVYQKQARARGYYTEHYQRRMKDDPVYVLRGRLRSRVHSALKGKTKTFSTTALLGCSADSLRVWIELQFLPGMSWSNRSQWEIDHKRPLSSFDLNDPDQLAAACHFTNLQPLWRRDNRSKGARWR